jgi:hypothetical protein
MSTALTLTSNDLNELAALPRSVRDEVLQLEQICKEIASAKSVSAGIREAMQRHGVKEGTIKRKFNSWRKRGWRALVNNSKVGRAKAALDIGDTFKGYCERNQRSSAEAYRQMMRDFRNGKPFPDIGTWREVWRAEHPDIGTPDRCPMDYTPRGWHYTNLMKSCGLSKYEINAARIGRGRARDFLPSVYSSRVDLPVGSMMMIDDMWLDAKVNFPGNTKAQRCIELAVVDVASGCRFAYGMKPRMENLETGRMRNLNDCDMRQLLAHILCNVGFNSEGCRIVVEHGTAAASSELEEIIKQLSCGLVTFERGGMISDALHKGLYCGQPRGNYKRKAALESQHSLVHTVAAALAGQIGKDRDHSPEQMYGLEQHNNQLLKAAAALPPERAKLLMLPLLDFFTFRAAYAELIDIMNRRDWHNLEGWIECGYTDTRYRISPASNNWIRKEQLLDLPPDEYAVLYGAIQAFPEKYSATVKLSPQDVFDAGAKNFTRLPKACMPQILGDRLAVIKTVRDDGLITYCNQEFGPSEFRYLARDIETPDGFRTHLEAGRKYVVHINPFNLDECFISDVDSGSYIGLARRWQTVSKVNVEAIERMAGKQAHIEAELRAPLARRGAKLIKEKVEMHRNNAAVFSGAPVSDEEIFRAEKVNTTRINADDLAAITERPRFDDDDEFSDEEISNLLTD